MGRQAVGPEEEAMPKFQVTAYVACKTIIVEADTATEAQLAAESNYDNAWNDAELDHDAFEIIECEATDEDAVAQEPDDE